MTVLTQIFKYEISEKRNMRFRTLSGKYGKWAVDLQQQTCRNAAWPVALALVAICGAAGAQTTSPLDILNQAPKVKFDDQTPTPTPVSPGPVPYVPPRGPAPYVAPAYPALTPYSGQSVAPGYQGAPRPGTPPPAREELEPEQHSQPDYLNYGATSETPAPPATRGGIYSTPTPRPVLGPEDVERQKPKKKGFVRGLINAIPFVGDDDEPTPTPAPTPLQGRTYQRSAPPVEPEEPVYRGYDAAPPSAPAEPSGTPLLMAPGSRPGPGPLPSEPEPSSPPIMTPTPRGVAPTAVEPPADASAPVLTVKKEGEETSAPEATPAEAAKPEATPENLDAKRPSTSDTETPAPSDSGVVIQDTRPKAPEPTGIKLDAATPPPVEAVETTATTAAADTETSLVIEQSDLGMPNPTYEQNTSILGEFQAAIRRARAQDYAAAAQQLKDYANNHRSSGLAPRAAYLGVIFEKNTAAAREAYLKLKEAFPDNHYVKDAEKRRPELVEKTAVAAATPAPDEQPAQKAARLEKELTVAVGDVAKEPALRTELGEAYLKLDEYDRAWEVLRPALDMTAGSPGEAKVMLLMARCHLGRKDTARAVGMLEAVEQKHPGTIMTDAETAWNAGLAYEATARYTRARNIYNEIRLKWPGTPEATWAETRLRDLAALAQ